MLVDTHSHVWLYPEHLSQEVASEFMASRLRKQAPAGGRSAQAQLDWTAISISPEQHWQHAQHADRTVVLAFRSRTLGFNVPNEYVAQYVSQHAEQLIGFACVDPNDADAVDELESCVVELGMKGLKLAPCYQHFNPTDPSFVPLYEKAEALNIPILWHMGATVLRRAPLDISHPLLLQEIALRFPALRMIVAHLAHPWEDETIALLRQCPNLWADISALYHRPWRFYNALVTAVEYRVTDKLLFGSDYSAGTVPATLRALEHINDFVAGTNLPRVPDAAVASIIYENWRGILGDIL
jgi:uncharacterized protein